MEQLASMLARNAMPAGTGTGAPGAESTATVSPLLQGVTDGLPDREVCAIS
jgi:hypothetical protein